MLSDSVVERTTALARATDTLEAPVAANYQATFHDLLKGVAMVFAPCGCTLAIGASGDSLITICLKAECTFEWREAESAYRLLVRPEPVIDITSVAVASQSEEAPIDPDLQELS